MPWPPSRDGREEWLLERQRSSGAGMALGGWSVKKHLRATLPTCTALCCLVLHRARAQRCHAQHHA
eukprot:15461891-Alexandrium_andersonii.AAC.1